MDVYETESRKRKFKNSFLNKYMSKQYKNMTDM